MENKRVVVDTNVFISALIGQYSYPYRIFHELVLTGRVELCMSAELMAEYEGVCQREKFRRFPQFYARALELIELLKLLTLNVRPAEPIQFIKDEADNRVLELAVAANAFAIVTGNTNDFTFIEYRGIQVYSPKNFYEKYQPLLD